MFGLLECQPVLGYDRSWLVLDLRMQCYDQAYWYFGMVALFTLTVYSTGMPVWFLVTLQQRRHRLDEAKAVVMKRYSAWRAHLKRAADLRIPEEDMAGAQELVRVDADILFMHSQFDKFRKEWDGFEFIYEDYQTRFYYWELVEIVRKQLIVAFSSILSIMGDGYDTIFGCVVSYVFFALHCGVLPYIEARENFIKGGEIGVTYLVLFLQLLRMLAENDDSYDKGTLGMLSAGTTFIFVIVVGISLVWNFRAGMEELEAMKEEAEAESSGETGTLDIYSVFFAVKLVNKCVRNRLHKRYEWDKGSSIGGDSLLSSRAASSAGRDSLSARGSHHLLDDVDSDDDRGIATTLMQPHVKKRWMRLLDQLLLIEGLPEPDFSSQDEEIGMLSEDTASVLDDMFADPTDDDVSDFSSDGDSAASNVSLDVSRPPRRTPGTNPQAAGDFSEEGVGIDRVDWEG